AWRTIDENATAADDGGADRVEHFVLEHEMRKRRSQRLRAAADAGHRLAIGLLDVIIDRYRRRADIGARLHRFLRAFAAQVGQHESITDAADQIAALHFEAFFVLEKLE